MSSNPRLRSESRVTPSQLTFAPPPIILYIFNYTIVSVEVHKVPCEQEKSLRDVCVVKRALSRRRPVCVSLSSSERVLPESATKHHHLCPTPFFSSRAMVPQTQPEVSSVVAKMDIDYNTSKTDETHEMQSEDEVRPPLLCPPLHRRCVAIAHSLPSLSSSLSQVSSNVNKTSSKAAALTSVSLSGARDRWSEAGKAERFSRAHW